MERSALVSAFGTSIHRMEAFARRILTPDGRPGCGPSSPPSRLLWALLLLASGAAAQPQPAPPTFSVTRGFQQAPDSLALSSPDSSAIIYYTTDGSIPVPGDSPAYTGPLAVDSTLVVRAVAVGAHSGQSTVETHSLLFLEDIVGQQGIPPDYPATWDSYPADYDMDPEITRSAEYAPLMEGALRSIPSLLVSMSPEDLFHPSTGIYTNTEQRGESWERPASLEWIEPSNRAGFQIDAGIRIMGASSRDPFRTPKHSFRVKFESQYGPPKLRYPLFGPEGPRSFDQLTLRGGNNNRWVHRHGDDRRRAQYIRNVWMHDAQRAMGQPSPRARFAHLYVNGLYWGLYEIVERPDESFLSDHLGGAKEDWDAVKYDGLVSGSLDAWNTMMALAENGLSSPSAYAAIQEYVDLDNFIDFIILNQFAGNFDWDQSNWYAARRRVPAGGFLFFVWDSERILEGLEDNYLHRNYTNKPTRLFNRLKENAEFRMRFADRVYRHLAENGALTPDSVAARWMRRAAEIDLAVIAESARWGDYRSDVEPYEPPYRLYTRNDDWLAEQKRLLETYFPHRTGVMFELFRQVGLYPAIDPPGFNVDGGVVDQGTAIVMNSPNGEVVYTTDGSDPRLAGGGVSPGAMVAAGTASLPISTSGTLRVRARQGAVWSALREATFQVREHVGLLTINEIHYHPVGEDSTDSGNLEFVELTNPGTDAVVLDGLRIEGGIQYTFSAGSSMEAGSHLVLASEPEPFAEAYGFLPFGAFEGRLSNAGELILLLEPNGGVIDSVRFDDGGGWPAGADGLGGSLSLIDPMADNASPEGWGVSATVGGSPGQPNTINRPPEVRIDSRVGTATFDPGIAVTLAVEATDPEGAVALVEFFVDGEPMGAQTAPPFVFTWDSLTVGSYRFHAVAHDELGSRSASDTLTIEIRTDQPCDPAPAALVINEISFSQNGQIQAGDWVELFNPEPAVVPLAGWVVKDEHNLHAFVFDAGEAIGPGGFLVLTQDSAAFAETYLSEDLPVGGSLPFGLGEKDMVRLYSPTGCLVDWVAYEGDTAGGSAVPEDHTLSLINPSLDNSEVSHWAYSLTPGGTPGSVNDAMSGTDTEDDPGGGTAHRLELHQNFPNPFSTRSTIRLQIVVPGPVRLAVYDLIGNRVAILLDRPLAGGVHEIDIEGAGLAPGVYFYVLETAGTRLARTMIRL